MYLDPIVVELVDRCDPDADPEQVPYLLYLLYALLAKAKGVQVTAEDVHDAWSIWQQYDGDANHRSLKPFQELAPEVQALDAPYVLAIQQAALKRKAAADVE